MLWCENTFTCPLLSLLEVSVKVGILPDPRTLCGPEAGASNPWCWRQQSCCPVGCWHPALWGHLTWCPPFQARAGEERRQDVGAEPQSCSCGWSAPGRLGPSPKAALYFLERAGHHARAETPSPRASGARAQEGVLFPLLLCALSCPLFVHLDLSPSRGHPGARNPTNDWQTPEMPGLWLPQRVMAELSAGVRWGPIRYQG